MKYIIAAAALCDISWTKPSFKLYIYYFIIYTDMLHIECGCLSSIGATYHIYHSLISSYYFKHTKNYLEYLLVVFILQKNIFHLQFDYLN